MSALVRPCLSWGITVASVSAFALIPASGQAPPIRPAPPPAVVLAAQPQPLGPSAPVAATPSATTLHSLPALINQQVMFDIDLAANFLGNGALLVGRQIQAADTLVRDVQAGTPVPVAAGRALQSLAQIEIDAGRELVGFGAEIVDFEVRFIADAVRSVVLLPAAFLSRTDVTTAKPTVRQQLDEIVMPREKPSRTAQSHSNVDTSSVETLPAEDRGSTSARRGSSRAFTASDAADHPRHRGHDDARKDDGTHAASNGGENANHRHATRGRHNGG